MTEQAIVVLDTCPADTPLNITVHSPLFLYSIPRKHLLPQKAARRARALGIPPLGSLLSVVLPPKTSTSPVILLFMGE